MFESREKFDVSQTNLNYLQQYLIFYLQILMTLSKSDYIKLVLCICRTIALACLLHALSSKLKSHLNYRNKYKYEQKKKNKKKEERNIKIDIG